MQRRRTRAPLAQLLPEPPSSRQEPLTEAGVQRALEDFQDQAESMFGRHPRASAIGITGEVALVELDGPFVLLSLGGRFWHKRETVLRNAAAFLRARIPEIADVELAAPDELDDIVYDDETGAVLEARRAPDWNGDRETLEYQGIDPDSRGPFAQPSGGFRG